MHGAEQEGSAPRYRVQSAPGSGGPSFRILVPSFQPDQWC